MRAISIHEFGGAEQLRLEEVEQPQPRADEVLIKNVAAGINYAESDWAEQVLSATNGKGANVILEMVGGDIGRQNLKCLATCGTMIVYGSASREDFHISAWGLLANMHTVKGYYPTLDSPHNRAQYSKELMEHIKAGRLQVMVTEFPLAQAADAHRAIEGRTTMGKVVLAIN